MDVTCSNFYYRVCLPPQNGWKFWKIIKSLEIVGTTWCLSAFFSTSSCYRSGDRPTDPECDGHPVYLLNLSCPLYHPTVYLKNARRWYTDIKWDLKYPMSPMNTFTSVLTIIINSYKWIVCEGFTVDKQLMFPSGVLYMRLCFMCSSACQWEKLLSSEPSFEWERVGVAPTQQNEPCHRHSNQQHVI